MTYLETAIELKSMWLVKCVISGDIRIRSSATQKSFEIAATFESPEIWKYLLTKPHNVDRDQLVRTAMGSTAHHMKILLDHYPHLEITPSLCMEAVKPSNDPQAGVVS